MKAIFRLYCISSLLLFIAWIAKMQFIFGGDYLFRISTTGILISIIIQTIFISKNKEVKDTSLTKVFLVNNFSLLIVYMGMMLKVAHLMQSQFQKDLILDFVGIPVIVSAIIYNFVHIDRILNAPNNIKLIFYKNVLLPWLLFLFSFLLYAVYSVVLTRAL